ncbi:MAG: alpha-L-glutamate ligase-like protein [Syntrophorhabdaceae bacterium]|nr:alpha-L-glutamate ligase-like protein [Syntrophorhabdaceae bacterium]
MFDILDRLREKGILGMNRRNAEYIMKYNPRPLFPLVDNKVLTKQLAQKHGIPTPKIYQVISHHGDIRGLKKKLKDHKEFALKPARGSGGSGIILIVNISDEGFVTQSSAIVNLESFNYHISSILSGIYSLGGLPDAAIIESLIHPDPIFANVTYKGVPDIRIIVYRGIPVMSMTRLPTKASDGKANLHRGAIGVGIDISKGETLSAVHGSRIITHHPDTGNPVQHIKVPFWEDMLLMAAKSYDMTGLGYIGVDMVIDRDRGPVLLELNARPGLQIQVANQNGLLRRLEHVDRAPAEIFAQPDTRVAWAKDTFNH